MLDKLPSEILNVVITTSCKGPGDYINLRNVNRELYTIINKKSGLFLRHNQTNPSFFINDFCNKKTNINTFDWFLKNNVQFTLTNIKQLIMHNRVDVFKRGFFYSEFLDLIFNRFYVDPIRDENSNIFTIIESHNPLIIAGIYNRVGIIQLLLEKSSYGNPYLKMLNSLLNISIKYNHKKLLSYLIINYYQNDKNIRLNINDKLIKIIHRVKNCEDILFYLYTRNIKIESKHLPGLIMMKYNEFFLLQYQKYFSQSNDLFQINLLSNSVAYNNIEIFNLLFSKLREKLSLNKIEEVIFRKEINTEFIYNLVNNHKKYIPKKSRIIKYCIENNINEEIIIELIKNDYVFCKIDMEYALQNNYIQILYWMCNKYDKLNENILK